LFRECVVVIELRDCISTIKGATQWLPFTLTKKGSCLLEMESLKGREIIFLDSWALP
jgi:hypothetical protein